MKRISFLAIVLLAFAFPAHAQDATKKDATVKPADPELKVVLDSWNEVGRNLIAMAEDFPEDKYDFKPTPAQRSFAEQLLHAAGANYFFTNPVMGKEPPAAEDPKRDQYKSKADIVAFVKKSFADGAAAFQSKGEKGLTTEVVYFAHQKARVLVSEINNLRRQAFFAFRLEGGCAIGEGFLDERNDVGLGLVLVALGIFCCRRLLPHDGIGEEIVCSCRMQQLLCEAALRRRGLEVVFVLRKILGHGDEVAANLVPGIQHDLQFGVGRFDGCIFLRRVLGMGGKYECQQDDSEKRYSFHFFLLD